MVLVNLLDKQQLTRSLKITYFLNSIDGSAYVHA